MERRPDEQASLDVHRREIALPKGVPVLRLDRDIAALYAVAHQQGVDLRLAVGQQVLADVGLQHTTFGLETLERIVGQFRRQNLGLFAARTGDIERNVIHRNRE